MRSTTRTTLGAALVAALTVLTLPAASAGPLAPHTEKVSTAPGGAQADNSSSDPVLSGDGKVVAFASDATNLVAGDTPHTLDVFLRPAPGAPLQRVTVAGASTSGASLSRDGRVLAFVSSSNDTNEYGVHLRDVRTGRTERLAPALGDAYAVSYGKPALSANGRFAAFTARPTDATPAAADDGPRVYLYDRTTGKAERISHSPDDADGARGCFVGSVSDDGTKVVYQDSYLNGPRGDDWGDIFVYDRTSKKTVQADATYNGAEADKASTTPLLSADGRTVAFQSFATNLVPGTDPNRGWNPFVYDLRTKKLTRVDAPTPTDISAVQGLSADGSKLLYSRSGSAEGHYVRDLRTGKDVLATPGLDGKGKGAGSSVLSADASAVAFSGYDESQFVAGDTNGEADVFLRRLK
ncbi:TolB family protein [Streptomyces sp. NPDC058657]|uniref:TolB family protein n=1 Tax=unclassified Streptomyces TaxID=2593676 RepID=UPI00365427A7